MKTSRKRYRMPGLIQVQLSTKNNIFSASEFESLVRYERIRSDRNGNHFSVAVFSMPDMTQIIPQRVISELANLSRAIDCIGWSESSQVSVLLPDTSKDGAEVFSKKVVEGVLETCSICMDVSLYSYPEHWLANSTEFAYIPEAEHQELRSFRERLEVLFVKKIPGWKRVTDITFSLMLVVLCLPILAITAIYIKLVSPGPVIFKQTRIGYKGLPFTLYKFRSMHVANNQGFHGKHAQQFIKDGDVPMEKLDGHDSRIIFGGKILRKSCIDELPQLLNVLRGDMSLVGPRPCIPYEAKEYLRWHTHRFDVLPGLSGLWQVSGKNKLTFKQMIRLDITYCQTISFFRDMAIIFMTPISIVKMIVEAILSRESFKADGSGGSGQNGMVINL